MPLTPEQQIETMRRVAAWRAEPGHLAACPACGKEGLEIVDRSARPCAEWYALTCPYSSGSGGSCAGMKLKLADSLA
jgi:hypothetical protein